METFEKCSFFPKFKPSAQLPASPSWKPQGRAYAPEGKAKILII